MSVSLVKRQADLLAGRVEPLDYSTTPNAHHQDWWLSQAKLAGKKKWTLGKQEYSFSKQYSAHHNKIAVICSGHKVLNS